MSDISMREMLEAGVHFGHQTRYWNPQMAAYLYGHRNKIHIIDLEQTKVLFQEALNYIGKLSANKGTILFVGTKRAAQQIIREEAERCGMPYVNLRWLGGLLTNYKTVKQSINRLRELEEMKTNGALERLSKKEALHIQRELDKLERNMSGIKDMDGWPDALFIIDVGYEDIAVSEAVKLKIPVVAVVDSNNSPTGVDYVIPGNDDALRSIRLYTKAVADAIIEGRDSVAHLGDGGDKEEFIELDAEGSPIVKEQQEKQEKKEKVQVKKKAARKVTKKEEPAKAEPTATDAAGAEPAKAESEKTESDKTESDKTEPAKAEPAETEPAEAEPTETDAAKTEPAEAEPAKAEPTEAESAKTEPAEAEPTETDAAKTEPAEAEPVEADSGTEPEDVAPATEQEAATAVSEEDTFHDAVIRRLAEIASQRELVSYTQLSRWIEGETGHSVKANSNEMYDMLDAINRRELEAGRGMLSAVVVRQREKTPGAGFYKSTKGVGTTEEKKEKFWKKELDKVYDAHATK